MKLTTIPKRPTMAGAIASKHIAQAKDCARMVSFYHAKGDLYERQRAQLRGEATKKLAQQRQERLQREAREKVEAAARRKAQGAAGAAAATAATKLAAPEDAKQGETA